jgi:nitrogen fixation/metabolism regulation signal transduction histidine kinase
MIMPDINLFFISYTATFGILAILMALLVAFIVKKLITDPIKRLGDRIRGNNMPQDQKNSQ